MKFTLNGQEVDAQSATADTPLLYVLRNDMQLNGPKFGCGLGECGACAVLIDGKVARSCSVPLKAVDGKKVTTLEGLSPDASKAASAQALQDRAVLDVSAETKALPPHAPTPCMWCSKPLSMPGCAVRLLHQRNDHGAGSPCSTSSPRPATKKSGTHCPAICAAAAPMWKSCRPPRAPVS
jgi:hypothetical protein